MDKAGVFLDLKRLEGGGKNNNKKSLKKLLTFSLGDDILLFADAASCQISKSEKSLQALKIKGCKQNEP